MASSRVSPSTCTWPGSSARRSARRRSCSGDSSPDTYSVGTPAPSRRAAHCSSSVDFPIPGSPPTSTTDPGTIPPPNTKSNSANPVFHRSTTPPCTSARRTGGTPVGRYVLAVLPAFPPYRPAASSTRLFHAPQASQRPDHFGCSAPHSVQRNTERPLGIRALGHLAGRVVVEAGVFLFEVQLDRPGGTVALLADDHLGLPLDAVAGLGVAGAVVELLPVDEAHDVRVLLDGARLAQVGELGAAVLAAALLRRPRQLRDRHHGHVQLLGEPLQGAGDVGDLLLAVLDVARPRHELQVVDDDERDVVLGLEAPRLGPHRERRERRGVVDPDRRGAEEAR